MIFPLIQQSKAKFGRTAHNSLPTIKRESQLFLEFKMSKNIFDG